MLTGDDLAAWRSRAASDEMVRTLRESLSPAEVIQLDHELAERQLERVVEYDYTGVLGGREAILATFDDVQLSALYQLLREAASAGRVGPFGELMERAGERWDGHIRPMLQASGSREVYGFDRLKDGGWAVATDVGLVLFRIRSYADTYDFVADVTPWSMVVGAELSLEHVRAGAEAWDVRARLKIQIPRLSLARTDATAADFTKFVRAILQRSRE